MEPREPHKFYRVYIQDPWRGVDECGQPQWVGYRYWPDQVKKFIGYLNRAYLSEPPPWNGYLVEYQKGRYQVLHKEDAFDDGWVVIGQSGSVESRIALYGISGLPIVEDELEDEKPTGLLLLPLDTDEQKSSALELAMSMYAGEPCRVCGKDIETADLRTIVFAGYKPKDAPGFGGRCAHHLCWYNLSTDERDRFLREAEISKNER